VTLAVAVPDVSLVGAVALDINTTGAPAAGLPAGPYLRVSGTDLVLTVLGQELRGSFVVEQVTTSTGARVVRLAVSGGSLRLLGTAMSPLVSVSDVAGLLVVTPAGIAGSLSARLTTASSLPVSISGALQLQVNTTAAAVSSSLQVGSGHRHGRRAGRAVPAGAGHGRRADGRRAVPARQRGARAGDRQDRRRPSCASSPPASPPRSATAPATWSPSPAARRCSS
jgi:hypothetical protein